MFTFQFTIDSSGSGYTGAQLNVTIPPFITGSTGNVRVAASLSATLGNFTLTSATLAKRRALTWASDNTNRWRQVTDVELGSGVRPLVVMPDGSIRLQVSSEGTPIVLSRDLRNVKALDPVNELLEV